jgi:dihydroneopterin aldolase
MARIHVKNLTCYTTIGIHPWEKGRKQKVILNIEIEFDASKSAKSDNIKDTIDYEKISNSAIASVTNSKYELIEGLVQSIVNDILADKRVISAKVTLDKPEALETAESVSISIEQSQNEQIHRKPRVKS